MPFPDTQKYINPTMKRFLTLFILLSIFFHLSGYWGSFVINTSSLPHPNINKSIEISLVEKEAPSKDSTQLPAPIRFTEAPKELQDNSLDMLKKKVDVLSEKVQRVKKETRADLFGLTKNRANQTDAQKNRLTPPSKPSEHTSVPKTSNSSSSIDSLDGTLEQDLNRNSNSQIAKSNSLDPGLSTFGNQLNKNVDIGAFTALNTDRHLFYSFYSRIEDMIRPPWEDVVSSEARRLNATNPFRPKGGWSSRIDVILNPDGRLVRVALLKSSGIKGFDNAAISAFQKADFFPHPPKGMINEDGVIVLKYLFTVY